MRRIASVILLGGSVRPSRFHDSIGRWALDLPHSQDASGRLLTLLDAWVAGVSELSAAFKRPVPLRILAGQSSETPLPAVLPDSPFAIDKDPIELRGTGGVLRDISVHYSPDNFILVANAAQVLFQPLPEIANSLDALHADVAVLAHKDGSPTTLMLIRCGSLAPLPAMGFLDMKEQALPTLAASQPVHVVSSPTPVARGVRTAKSYVAALRSFHLGKGAPDSGRRSETWRSAFQIIEPAATVDPTARLYDSVVLKNARVGRNAVLVRSVVCPGAVVDADQVIVDKLILGNGEQLPTEEAS